MKVKWSTYLTTNVTEKYVFWISASINYKSIAVAMEKKFYQILPINKNISNNLFLVRLTILSHQFIVTSPCI